MRTEEIESQLKLFNKLYITKRDKYIIQNKDGTYTHSEALKFNKKLTDTILYRHILKQSTIGIFCNEKSTKFMLFDIDLEGETEQVRQTVVRNIIDAISDFGFSEEFCNISLSGNKGYHITIFFSDLVYLNLAYKFYEYILCKTGYTNIQVEFRPTATVGVKLPLSIHRKTGKLCRFVDKNFNRITDDHLKEVRILDRDYFQNRVKEINLNNEKVENIRVISNSLSPNKIKLLSVAEIRKIESNGIISNGTRNYCTVQLAVMYNTEIFSKAESLSKLNTWIDNQSNLKFKTSLLQVYKENEKIINWVFDNNIRLSAIKNITINITKKEINALCKVKDLNSKRMALTLLIHWKVFGKIDFTMTYNQIMETGIITHRSNFKKCIDNLKDMGYINVESIDLNIANRTQNKYSVLFGSVRDSNIEYIIDILGVDYISYLPIEMLSRIYN